MKELENLKKELLDKEMELVDMDNVVIAELNSNSLFESEDDCVEQNSCSYYVKNAENEIVVEWEIVKQAENNLNTIVKVTDIWES